MNTPKIPDMIPFLILCRRSALTLFLATLPLAVGGCGRSPATVTASEPPPAAAAAPNAPTASPRPTQADLAAFLTAEFPREVRVDVQSDTPVPAGPAQPGVWLVPVKVTLTPLVDAFARPQEADVAEYNQLIAELNELINWRNAFARSGFAATYYPDLSVGGPDTPPFIALKNPKGKALKSLYGKFTAERQVDRWAFTNVDVPFLELADQGQPRSEFPPNAVVIGSPQAQALLTAQREAIARAQAKRKEVTEAYEAMVTAATEPGVRYVGKIVHEKGTVAAEVRFLARPGGQKDNAAFVVSLPNDPPYALTFTGALNRELPMQAEVPDLRVHIVRTPNTGKSSTDTVQGTMVAGLDTATTRTFSFSTGKDTMKGEVNVFNGRHRFTGTRAK